jgi:hypothetical protein
VLIFFNEAINLVLKRKEDIYIYVLIEGTELFTQHKLFFPYQ